MANHPPNPDIDLLEGTFYSGDPHPAYEWMRRNAPLFHDAANDVWGVATYDGVLAVSKDPATFSNAGGIRPESGPLPMMIDMDDPEHWTRRKLVNRGFTPRRVRESEPYIRGVCDRIIDRVCERGECDFVRDVAAQLPMIIIGDMLGVREEDHDDLLRWSDDMLRMASGSPTEEIALAAATAMEEYQAYVEEVIADRRVRAGDDLVSILVHAEVDGDRLDDEELVYESLLILIGGDETTRHVLSGGMEQLALHPEQWRLLVADRSKIPTAVEEMLRWVTPIKNMCRTATRDVHVMGEDVREGQKLMLLYESANRDDSRFPDPYRFDVQRHPNEHVAFGFGTHFCLGNSLARLEIRLMLEQLAARLPDLELAADPATLPRRPGNFVSGLESMPVRFSPSRPAGR